MKMTENRIKRKMRVLSICNLKGGVGKTTTAVNLAGILATDFGKRVLVIDNDQQGNASQFFQVFHPDNIGTAEILCLENEIDDCIKKTSNPNIDVVPANMNLAAANHDLISRTSGMPTQIRLREALKQVAEDYDFAIIDNGPNLEVSFINAIVSSDDFIIPVKIDKYSFYGISTLMDQIQDMSYWKPHINFVGCLVTMQHSGNQLENEGVEWLAGGHASTGNQRYKIMNTKIKYSPRVNDTTFGSELITVLSGRSQAARNYKELAAEYLEFVANNAVDDTARV